MSTVPNAPSQGSEPTPIGAGQYLIFSLADEEYAVDILKVQEIRSFSPVTRVPNSLPYVLGVLNQRGNVVPIIDLRLRFGLPKVEYSAATVVVILTVAAATGKRVLGIVVDGVSDVLEIPAEAIKPAPELGAMVRSEFIAGMATIEDRTLVVLHSDQLLMAEEIRALEVMPKTV